jgi:hypothetical protein
MPPTTQPQTRPPLPEAPPLAIARSWDMAMTASERRAIASQLITALGEYYVHLPLKVSALAINPLQEARLLYDDAELVPNDLDFFRRVLLIVKKLRDRHTAFKLPPPWANAVAVLPFAAESFWENGQRKLLVTKVAGDVGDPHFVPGVELTHWNGSPVGLYVQNLSWNTDGAHPYARIALALRSLTVRPLAFDLPPDEDWASLTYVADGVYKTVVIPWRLFVPPPGSRAHEAAEQPRMEEAVVLGVDESTLIVNGVWHDLLAGYSPAKTPHPYGDATGQVTVPPVMMGRLSAQTVDTRSGTFGYVRLFSFDFPDSTAFLRAFADILRQLPQNGLILDLRGNPGGTIPSGEAIVQLFTDRPVEAAPVVFRNTLSVRRLVSGVNSFGQWRRSLEMLFETGQTYSQGFSLTDLEEARAMGRVYGGKVVLVIDALCYSTTDFFAADMQDHGLARIIGVDPVTGAGGANVWPHSLLADFVAAAGGFDVTPMPRGADLNIAMRQAMRVGPNVGLPSEGLGVRADVNYRFTRRDVLGKNEDLIEFAAKELAGM